VGEREREREGGEREREARSLEPRVWLAFNFLFDFEVPTLKELPTAEHALRSFSFLRN